MKLGLDKDLVWIILSGEALFSMVTCSCESKEPDGLIYVVLVDG